LTKEERELFDNPAEKKLKTVIDSSKQSDVRQGETYNKFKEEFKDIFEMKLDNK
jgi:hypothetical protein